MLIENQLIEVNWNSKIKRYYVEKGYTYTKMGDVFLVKLEDLTKRSAKRIKIKCDYCLEDYETTYLNYTQQKEKNIIKKDACLKCRKHKLIESNQLKYGVNSTSQIPEVKKKQMETNLKKYGFTNAAKSEIIKEKMKKTSLERYGYESPFSSPEVQEKINKTNQEKYGVDYPFQSQEIMKKVKETNLKLYGYENPIQNELIKSRALMTNLKKYGVKNPFELEEFQIKAKNTIYNNDTGARSKQQIYISTLLKGILNYPVRYYLLDIAFPDENVFIEYNGGGHDLCVKLGTMTQEEYTQKEIVRNNILKREGWKNITIISRKDYLPNDKIIKKMLEDGKSIFAQGRSWVVFDIDNNNYCYFNFKEAYDYGTLIKIN